MNWRINFRKRNGFFPNGKHRALAASDRGAETTEAEAAESRTRTSLAPDATARRSTLGASFDAGITGGITLFG